MLHRRKEDGASIHNQDESYLYSEEKQSQLYKRTLIVVSISQILGGAGLAAGVTVGALLAEDMLGTDAYAGIPTAILTFGSALAAFLVGKYSQQFGRRLGLSIGFMLGGIGAIGVIMAAMMNSVILLFGSLFLYGAGSATNLQARYAGTDLAKEEQRATAVSIAMVFTTFGAVVGPNVVDLMGEYAESIGVPYLAGPFILGAAAYILAGITLFILLRPDPLIIANEIHQLNHVDELNEEILDLEVENKKGVIAGASIMIISKIVMVAIMTMTPVHMMHHGHGMDAVGFVIAIHVASMYLPSLVTGALIDKLGRNVMTLVSGIILLLSALLAAFSTGDSMIIMVLSLSLLGLGWNIGFISGTSIIIDATTMDSRANTQGKVDVFIALSGATSGVMSGVIVAGTSFATLSFIGGAISLLLIPIIFLSKENNSLTN